MNTSKLHTGVKHHTGRADRIEATSFECPVCLEGESYEYDETMYKRQVASQTAHVIVTEGNFPSKQLSEACPNGHLLCRDCHEQMWRDTSLQKKCPLCKERLFNPSAVESRKIDVFSHEEAVSCNADSDSAAARKIKRLKIEAEDFEKDRPAREERERVDNEALAVMQRLMQLRLQETERRNTEADRLRELGIKIMTTSLDDRNILCIFRKTKCYQCEDETEIGITFHSQPHHRTLCSSCMLDPTEEDRLLQWTRRESPTLQEETSDEDSRLALAMGLHARLGSDSRISLFSDDLMRIIFENKMLTDYSVPHIVNEIDVNDFNHTVINLQLYAVIKGAGHSDEEIRLRMQHNPHLILHAEESMSRAIYPRPRNRRLGLTRIETSVWDTIEKTMDGANLLSVGLCRVNDDVAVPGIHVALSTFDIASSTSTPTKRKSPDWSTGDICQPHNTSPPRAHKKLATSPSQISSSVALLDPQEIADMLCKYDAKHSNAFFVYENIGLTPVIRGALVAYIDSMRGNTNDDKIEVGRDQIISILTLTAGHEECRHFMDTIEGIFPTREFKIILRRTEADTVPRCIAFHKDDTLYTMAIPLNAPEHQCVGGQLVYLNEDGPTYVARDTNTLTLHDNTILHGISAHTSGVRWGMYLMTPLLVPVLDASKSTHAAA